MPEPISNDEFVELMKGAWQYSSVDERMTLFGVLEELIGTEKAIRLREAMQVSL